MFETLEDMREKSQRPMSRGTALFMYSFDFAVGLFYIISGMGRHQSLAVLVGAVVFLLSLIWLVATIRSPVRVSRRDVWVRGQIVICILMAYQAAYTVAR
jgi:Na+/melibiose symporter-like transporter